MGVVICQKHGRTGIVNVCPHLGAAARAQTDLPPWVSYVMEEFEEGSFGRRFCADCVERFKLPAPIRLLTVDEFERTEFGSDFACGRCHPGASS
jgi:hypothetical protein